ncbi:coniferyl-alcohol dehydrogenase [Trujillonella endophytica]|uniref:NAD(P)-dependent dehydrogenase, short-chain alcohol dehydrogenase family n=1 Tax=Trujillonella endophytica TaxID=673521 RepID=A0A1H8Q4I7_9ACTN|nr:coniferyl-alcohol dehydrogenase [Trujillella endophytica]SEO48881.1 NAD(P)-dependent dehydrogenase, short-chain alcohol dehydrogenase family [Trujillella endophytica]
MTFPGYRGRRVVVTGASSGIGRALARALVDLGAEVHGAALTGSGEGLASFRELDLADPASIEEAEAGLGGPVDVLFNCAGVVPMLDPDVVVAVNFLGTRLLTERMLERMGPGGAVVNVSSNGGFAWRTRSAFVREFVGTPTFEAGLAWYAAHREEAGHAYRFAKEALTVWTMLASAELIGRGIRMNVASPGSVQTPMLAAIEAVTPAAALAAVEQPSGRRSTPEEQVGPLLFLGSDAASYVTGADLPVDGGFWAAQTVAGRLH